MRGGTEEEQIERQLWIERDKKKISDSVTRKIFSVSISL
jgi:hypothetical protein